MMDSNLIKVNDCRSIVRGLWSKIKIKYIIVSIFEAADDLELVLNKSKPPSSCLKYQEKLKSVIKECNFSLFLSFSEISFSYLKPGIACDRIVKTNGFLTW